MKTDGLKLEHFLSERLSMAQVRNIAIRLPQNKDCHGWLDNLANNKFDSDIVALAILESKYNLFDHLFGGLWRIRLVNEFYVVEKELI